MPPVLADSHAIDQAAELLQQGRLVAFPTETVYGLGADARNPKAVAGIFQAKGRPANHPLIVHIADSHSLGDWARQVPDTAVLLAEHFWPGPLAMILPKHPDVPLAVTGDQQTVGLRAPNHPVALALLKAFAGGIAAPSANRFCRISPTMASHVFEELGDSVDMILDGGACQVGVESTIIDLSGEQPRILRPGHITSEQITAVIQMELLQPQFESSPAIRAPGMMDIHYAPHTQAVRCPGEQLPDLLAQLLGRHKTCGILSYQLNIPQSSTVHVTPMPMQASAYAQQLYAALRYLDNLNLDMILVEQPPQTIAWQAVNDRLAKATGLA